MNITATDTDTRIVYGIRCVWWDGIEKVGKTPPDPRSGISIPCCPHCGSPLMEMPDPAVWWRGIDEYEKNDHAGYHAFMEWLKGKCFPTIQAAKAVYEAKPGRTVKL